MIEVGKITLLFSILISSSVVLHMCIRAIISTLNRWEKIAFALLTLSTLLIALILGSQVITTTNALVIIPMAGFYFLYITTTLFYFITVREVV